ncbi:HAD-IIIA family hydrolase [candidate division NPL-UPA2 bacterium]|nr:HAD-IIIA family hydrolase [candidate division NPL-UPA2 bacterium]
MIEDRARKIRMLIMDVDGVLTDGRIVLGNQGEEFKFFYVQDGVGIILAHRAGLKTAIISARKSEVTERRARELGVNDVYQVEDSKEEAYEKILKDYHLKEEEVAYIGDDLHDLPLLKRAGLAVSVSNGIDEAKEIAHWTTKAAGGQGAVREVIEVILKSQGKWEEVTAKYR